MCESSAYLVNKKGEEEKIMDYVIEIVPNNEGSPVSYTHLDVYKRQGHTRRNA